MRQLTAGSDRFGAVTASLQQSVAIVSVIGFGEGPQLLTETLGALSNAGSHVLAMARGARTYHTSFVLPEEELPTAVRAIHAAVALRGNTA
jgi:aspartokinase